MKKRFNVTSMIMVILIVAVLGMGMYIFVDYRNDIKNSTIPSYLSKSFEIDDTKEIGNIIKEYSYDNNLAIKDNVKNWKFDSIKYIGYLETDSELEYYRVSGSYTCNDTSSDCVYMDQVIPKEEDIFSYEVYVMLRKHKDSYKLVDISSSVETVTNVLSNNEDGVRGTGYTQEELVNLYKDYLISNGYVLKPDLNEWNVNLTYAGRNKEALVFFASNYYTCLSGSYICIYQSQVGENPFVFDIALTMEKDVDGIYKFTSIGPKYGIELEETAMVQDIESGDVTRELVSTKLKEYYINNGKAVEDNLAKFDVTYVTYLGDLKYSPGMYGLKATITYACKDKYSSCVAEDLKKDPSSKDFTFSLGFNMVIGIDGEYAVAQIYPITNNDHVNLNTMVLK